MIIIFSITYNLIINEYSFVIERNICYDIINNNNGNLLDNTGLVQMDSVKKKIEYFGGFSNIIPYFYICSYCSHSDPSIINALLKLIIVIFKTKGDSQKEALNIKLFKIISLLINKMEIKNFNTATVVLIEQIKNILTYD